MTELDTVRRDLSAFRHLFEETLRLQGSPRQGLAALADIKALEAVFAGEVPFRGALITPLSTFSKMLASGSLPAEFSRFNFGDLCGALGEVLASKDAGRWQFQPGIRKETAEKLGLEGAGSGLDQKQRENESGWQRHGRENGRFVLGALEHVRNAGTAVIVGATRSYDLPLEQLVDRFDRVIVVDVCDEVETRSNVERALSASTPAALGRVSVERFDLTGSYNQFTTEAAAIVAAAKSARQAEQELDQFVSGYDVPADAARLCRAEVEPDLAISSMVLTQLGLAFSPFVSRLFRERGFPPERVREGILGESLAALSCRVEQQHIAALLRVPKLAVLTSDVREIGVTAGRDGDLIPTGASRPQLGVDALADRIPTRAKPLMRADWDWLRVVPEGPGSPGAVMKVEGVVLERLS